MNIREQQVCWNRGQIWCMGWVSCNVYVGGSRVTCMGVGLV